MEKLFLILFLLIAGSGHSFADTKISALDTDATPTTDDYMVTVDDPAGTPATKKILISGLYTLFKTAADLLYEPIDSAITKSDEVETIAANWVNTAHPWAVNEVHGDLMTATEVTTYCETTQNYLKTSENSDSDDDVTAADLGAASANIANDGTIEWEDAADLDNDGGISTNAVGDDEIDYAAITLDSFTFDVGGVSKAEFEYGSTVTSNIQDQIDTKYESGDSPVFLIMSLTETTTPGAIANTGAVYTKADNKLYFQDGDGAEHTIRILSEYFGEMYYTGAGDTITIVGADQYQAWTGPITGMVEGMVFEAGIVGVIASTSTDAGASVTINDATHGLTAGDMITINGTTTYNDIYEVQTVPDTGSFTITETNSTNNETGSWQRGSSLTLSAGSAGFYAGRWAASLSAATANDVFTLSPVVNTTVSPKAQSRRKFSNTDIGSMGGTGLITAAVGDKIFFVIKNESAARDMTIVQFDMNILMH